MGRKIGLVVMAMALAGGLSACASRYGIPDGGPHFKSWDHMRYSVWWVGEKPPLSREDLEKSKAEGWWGVPIRYTVDEVK